RLGQSLTMTPQLQQAIRLLQLSTLDLQQEIQEALDSNPMLELEEHGDSSEAQDTTEREARDVRDKTIERESASNNSDNDSDIGTTDSEWNTEIPQDLPVDT